MNWIANINLVFDPLRELAERGGDVKLQEIFSNAVPELKEIEYDNWNGGTTYYQVVQFYQSIIEAAND